MLDHLQYLEGYPGGNELLDSWVSNAHRLDKAFVFLVSFELANSLPNMLYQVFVTTTAYGRFASRAKDSGVEKHFPGMPARLGWVVMEAPASIFFVFFFALGIHERKGFPEGQSFMPLVLLGIWQLHYVERSFNYPRLLRPSSDLNSSVALLGFVFNTMNAFLNAWFISFRGTYPNSWRQDPRFVVGSVIFLIGYIVNRQSDRILIGLRKKDHRKSTASKKNYKIPHGGLFRFVSCPNYFGESLIWLGWAILSWSIAGFAFWVFTIANLYPRALRSHRWYQETFPEYPKERKAVLPFIL